MVFDIQRFSVHDGPGIRTTVFLKGCPLGCLWCHNPESRRIKPEISFESDLCILCGNCIETCPESAPSIDDGHRTLKRDLCAGCGRCVETCYTDAVVLKGTTMTADAVLDEVAKDAALYRKSMGGLTLSGGEPALQPEFSMALLNGAGERGFHTAVETCGFAGWEVLEPIVGSADYIIYDLKHLDSEIHKQLTGSGNGQILANLERIAAMNKALLVRIPLIPGCNDDEDNLEATAAFITKLGIDEIEIIPYHDFAAAKYELIETGYVLKDIKAYSSVELERKKEVLEGPGINVKIGI